MSLKHLIKQAEMLMVDSQWDQGVRAWRQIVELRDPAMPRGVFARLAQAYSKLGQLDKVLEVLQEAKLLGTQTPMIYQVASQAFANADRWKEALAISQDWIRHVDSLEDLRWALNFRAVLLAKSGDNAKAWDILSSVIESLGEAVPDGATRLAIAQVERIQERLVSRDAWEAYWLQRKNYVYLHVCRRLLEIVAVSARTVADIGSNRSPILDFFDGPKIRYSIDITAPYEGDGVIPVKEDFYQWDPPESIEVATCFQVIEHVPDPKEFARRMLEHFEVSLISVPYKEPPGLNPGHVNNHIDLERITEWFGRVPNFHYIARELSGDERIICLFDRETEQTFTQLHSESSSALSYRFRWSLPLTD